MFSWQLLALAVTASLTVSALPFGKDSGVVELTPQTLPQFLNTHKPVYIMFYAPWCGHCKSAHPEWEKFGKGVKDVVRVGAIDADKYREIGGQFGVKGFPTIKYWKVGPKKGKQPIDYQGQRSHGAFHNAAIGEITHQVVTPSSEDALREQINKAATKKVVVLFTSKPKPPPLFSVLSHSPHFAGKTVFVMVPEKMKLAKDLGITSFPTIAVVSINAEDGSLVKELYSGKMEYPAIAKFAQAQVLGVATAAAGGEESAGDAAAAPEAKKPEVHKRPAAPVRPVELTADGLKNFCSLDAAKIGGQQPFCVIATSAKLVDLTTLHAKYQYEPVHFFWVPEGKMKRWVQELSDQLQPPLPLEPIDVVVLRAAKDRVKYTVFRADPAKVTGDLTEAFDSYLGRAFGGDMSFHKHPKFPALTE